MGGVARRATVIREVREQTKHAVLVLDAGSTFFGQILAMQSEGRIIVDAMNAMAYDAMTVGLMDLLKGVDVLLQRAQQAKFAVVSCNIVNIESEEPILEPYAIIEREGIRFGIIGVSEPDVIRVPSEGVASIKVLDPVPTVQRYLPEVRQRSDLVILLSHLGFAEDKAIASAVPGIDVIVGGRSRKRMSTPERVGETIIVQMGYDGEDMGKLDVTFAAGHQILSLSLDNMYMGPGVADDAELSALVRAYRQKFATPTQPAR